MPILVPPKPDFKADRGAEKEVWTKLRDQLPDDVVLIHGLRITERATDSEGDLIVLWPDLGIAVIEVKGGSITSNIDGKFTQSGRGGKSKVVDPIDQARNMIYTLIKWFKSHTSLNRNYTYTSMAAFPYATISDTWSSTGATRRQIIDRRDLANIDGQVKNALLQSAGPTLAPNSDVIERMVASLESEVIDVTDPTQVAAVLDERAEQVQRFLQANEEKLDFVKDVHRFHVVGPAGSGKTAMAVSLAHRLTKQGQRVLYMCYSSLLANYLQHEEEKLNKDERIATVKNLHALGPAWGAVPPDNPGQEFWNVECPQKIAESALGASNDRKFDAVIVDEAQDFDHLWWDAVRALLRDPENGRIHAFSDSGQTIFAVNGAAGLEFVPLVLNTNLRNTQEISEGSNFLTDSPAECIGPTGPEILYCEVPDWADVTRAGDSIVERLLDSYRPSDVVLLKTWHKHPVHAALVERDSKAYRRQLWENDDIFYSTVMGFKGLERHCVILVVDGFVEPNLARELLYTGMTRAQDLLVIVSQRDSLTPHFDPALMKRLDQNRFDLAEDEFEPMEEDAQLDSVVSTDS